MSDGSRFGQGSLSSGAFFQGSLLDALRRDAGRRRRFMETGEVPAGAPIDRLTGRVDFVERNRLVIPTGLGDGTIRGRRPELPGLPGPTTLVVLVVTILLLLLAVPAFFKGVGRGVGS